jgi:hypothetical protein
MSEVLSEGGSFNVRADKSKTQSAAIESFNDRIGEQSSTNECGNKIINLSLNTQSLLSADKTLSSMRKSSAQANH